MKRNVVLVLLVALAAAPAAAEIDTVYDGKAVRLKTWTGSGANEAITVMDFGPGENFAFGYRWDDGELMARDPAKIAGVNDPGGDPLSPTIGADTGEAMLLALDADPAAGVTVDFTYWQFGLFLDTISYGGNTLGEGHYFPSYWKSEDGRDWTSSFVGVTDRVLAGAGQDWDGWSNGYYEFVDGINDISIPATEPVTPVPDPATVGLLAFGGIATVCRRRRA